MSKTVSIIIPCLNEEEYIGKCLDSIVRSTYDKKSLSVFVCDGLSIDGTRKIVEEYEKSYSFIHLIDNPDKITPKALNIGIQAIESDIKFILGAHSEIESNFIEENLNVLRQSSEIGCSGGVINNIYSNKKAKAIGKAMSLPFGVGNAYFRTGESEGEVDTVAFGAYKKEVFEKIGYFDEELERNQDDEFNYRVVKAGFKIQLSKKIQSKYYVRGSFYKVFNQYFQYGFWKVFVNKKHKSLTTFRQLIPALFVSSIIILSLLSIKWILFSNLLKFEILVYLIAALGYASKKAESLNELAQIVWTFILLHTSYGFGYILGNIKFFIFNKKPSKAKLTR